MQRISACIYLRSMDTRYQTLQTLYKLVKDTPKPTQYQCLPRQLILFLNFDWTTIYTHLGDLEKEGMVLISKADTIQFSITQKGIDKAYSIETIISN